MYGYVWLCRAVQGYVGLCRAMQGYLWLCRAMQGYVGLCRAVYGYVGLFRAVQGCVGLCRAVQDYVGLCTLPLVTNGEPLYDAYTTYLPTSMSCMFVPAMQSCDTGQRIPFFDGCQFITTWMSNTKFYTDSIKVCHFAFAIMKGWMYVWTYSVRTIFSEHYGTAPVDPCRPQNRGSHDYLRAYKGSRRMSRPLIQDSSVRVLFPRYKGNLT